MEAGPRDTAPGGEQLSPDGPDATQDGVIADGPTAEELASQAGGAEVEVELRPQRRLRLW